MLDTVTSSVEQRLNAAGFKLPTVNAQGEYAIAVKYDGKVWSAGKLSRYDHGVVTGQASGPEHLIETRHACRLAVLRTIAAVKTAIALDDVTQIIFLRGFIASTSTFVLHTQALDAASAILLLAFGPDVSRHARSAVGVSALPLGGLAELELVVGTR
jgi:enamine deaminase RidA (YjgF/YER057c/UK114 family)